MTFKNMKDNWIQGLRLRSRLSFPLNIKWFKSPQAEKRSRQFEAHLKVFLTAFHFPGIFQALDLHDKSYFPFHSHHWGVGVKKGKNLVSQGQTSPGDHVVNPHFHPPKPPPIKIMTTVPPTWVPHLFSIGLIHTPLFKTLILCLCANKLKQGKTYTHTYTHCEVIIM